MSKFNFNIDIEDNSSNNTLSKSTFKTKTAKQMYENYAAYVDFKLPSGTLWTKYNLGVDPSDLSSPEKWYGGYYAWGETEEKDISEYNWKHYKYAVPFGNSVSIPRYRDIDNLLLEDDAAYQQNQLKCTPTIDQIKELFLNTENYWINGYHKVKGLNGIYFCKGKEKMFIPAAGEKVDGRFIQKGSGIALWSSTMNSGLDCRAQGFMCANKKYSISINWYSNSASRELNGIAGFVLSEGMSIRPVFIKKNFEL